MIILSTPIPKPKLSYGALLGQVVERRRMELGINQADIAKTLGTSQSAYSRLEQGQSAMNVTQLRIIAERLGISSAELLLRAEEFSRQLRAQNVEITDQKPQSAGESLIAIGILVALIAAANS